MVSQNLKFDIDYLYYSINHCFSRNKSHTTLMSNVEKCRCNLCDGGVFHLLFKIFYVFLLLKRRFLFNNQHQLCLMSLRCVFRVLNIGISIMQWRIAVGVHTFRKAPFLRRKLPKTWQLFLLSCFLFVLYFAFQMFVGICTNV